MNVLTDIMWRFVPLILFAIYLCCCNVNSRCVVGVFQMFRLLLLFGLTLTFCSAIIVNDPPEQFYDYFYAGPELGFVSLPRFNFHNRPVYSVARAILPDRPEPDTYDLHGLYHPWSVHHLQVTHLTTAATWLLKHPSQYSNSVETNSATLFCYYYDFWILSKTGWTSSFSVVLWIQYQLKYLYARQ